MYCDRRGLLAESLRSQVALHAEYGGVVPELASRDHVRHLPGLLRGAMDASGAAVADIDAVAYTAGPGLIGALLAGASVAAGLAQAWQVPLLPVHHMEGHLLAPMLEGDAPRFPFLALLVSGGHSLLVACEALGRYRVLGRSLDDAVGEAFDKTASLLGLAYPGGPALAALAENGSPDRFRLPRPLTRERNLDFSFSGLKTAVALLIEREAQAEPADIARAFEEAVVDTLVRKCLWALEDSGLDELVVAGGVAANRRLRTRLEQELAARGARLRLPSPALCTDNGAMIAHLGQLRLSGGECGTRSPFARPRWPLDELVPPQ